MDDRSVYAEWVRLRNNQFKILARPHQLDIYTKLIFNLCSKKNKNHINIEVFNLTKKN